ncbi:MAG TPA: M48 family metallopeptidase [Thermoanaerobaculia bacterium]|nr:M48 family metallopeptidase [Thermoanaerobaculia bacterium]
MTNRPRTLKVASSSALLAVLLLFASVSASEAGVNLVSLDQEWAMREQLHAEVASQHRVYEDPYLTEIGRRIVAQTGLGNRPWNFFVVQDSSVNAFNLPGGLVYVNTGLLAEADTLDQLVGVMSHEIAHGAKRHGTQLMTRAYGYNLLAGLLLGRDAGRGQQIAAQLVGTGILTNYSRSAENEADRAGVGYMYRAGYDPAGMAEFFRTMDSLRSRRASKVEQFFSSHPLTDDRIRNVEAEISRLPGRRNLTNDTREYQRMRSRYR